MDPIGELKKTMIVLLGLGVGAPLIAWQYDHRVDPSRACDEVRVGLVDETDLFGYVQAKGYCVAGVKEGTWLEINRHGDLFRVVYENGVHQTKEAVPRGSHRIPSRPIEGG